MSTQYDAIIIGGGLAGLTAALHLEEFNLKPLIIDASDRVGGRIKTDEVEGFLLDHGFQVLLEKYALAQKYLDYKALDLKSFSPGAVCFADTESFTVKDVRRNKLSAFNMLFSPVGTLADKLKLGKLIKTLEAQTVAEIFTKPEMSTAEYLKKAGFSKKIIARFFLPFFSGIFLENKLETSSRMFEFVMKTFSAGDISIPAKGMEEIPKQLKSKLRHTQFRFHTAVKSVKAGKISLSNGEEMEHANIIVTVPNLVKQDKHKVEWHATATYYFKAPKSILHSNILALNYKKGKLVNNFTVMSDTSKHYAPKGMHLISVSLNDIPTESEEEISRQIKNELALSFGPPVQQWEFLKSYHIPHALPKVSNLQDEVPFAETAITNGVYLAGDYLLNPSINAAMQSGESAAKALILNFKAKHA
jgi:protoporphyrinogen oxidase